MICKKLFKRIRYSCFRRVHIKFLYTNKFDFTAKSLVTNAVVITSDLCKCTPSCLAESNVKIRLEEAYGDDSCAGSIGPAQKWIF